MALTIYHNPRCSKSRETLQIIRDAGIEPAVVLYLQEAPSAVEILDIARRLGCPVAQLLRHSECEFKQAADLPELNDDAELAAWLANHPAVLQRPVVIDRISGRAIIGRPPENVQALLS